MESYEKERLNERDENTAVYDILYEALNDRVSSVAPC